MTEAEYTALEGVAEALSVGGALLTFFRLLPVSIINLIATNNKCMRAQPRGEGVCLQKKNLSTRKHIGTGLLFAPVTNNGSQREMSRLAIYSDRKVTYTLKYSQEERAENRSCCCSSPRFTC